MKATMRMHAEPLFGGQVEFGVEAEVDNARMLNNRALLSQMARMLGYMADELLAESERVLWADAHGGDGEGTRLAQRRENEEEEDRGDERRDDGHGHHGHERRERAGTS